MIKVASKHVARYTKTLKKEKHFLISDVTF